MVVSVVCRASAGKPRGWGWWKKKRREKTNRGRLAGVYQVLYEGRSS